MKHKAFLTAMAVLSLLALTGCQLALPDEGGVGADRLIGVFLTRESLDLYDIESQLQDNPALLTGGDVVLTSDPKYEQRLYAQLTQTVLTNDETGQTHSVAEYRFEGLDGIPYYAPFVVTEQESYHASVSDPALWEPKLHVSQSDTEEGLELEASVYAAPGTQTVVYVNPVYQDGQGRVYLTAGSGLSVQGVHDEGEVCSTTLSSTTQSVRRQSAGQSEKEDAAIVQKTSVVVHVGVRYPAQTAVLFQYDASGALLSQQTYATEALPEQWTPDPNAAYLIAKSIQEDSSGSETAHYALYTPSDETLTFALDKSGLCVPKSVSLLWP